MSVWNLVLWIAAIPAIASASYFLIEWMRVKGIRELEAEFTTFLNSVVEGLRNGEAMETALMTASDVSKGPLKHEVGRIIDQIIDGATFVEALEDFGDRSNSRMIRQSVGMIAISIEHGAEMAETLDRIAQDMWALYMLQMERQMIAVKEARILMIGGVVMTPAILGFVFGTFSGVTGSVGVRDVVIVFMMYFSFLSALFYGAVSGRFKMAFIAAPAMIFIGLFSFWMGSGFVFH